MPGIVYLVGAGPGDPDLLTLRAARLIASCDVLVYDALINLSLLDWTRPGCEQIFVGKRAGCHEKPQAEIEKLLVQKGLEGKSVVRLKGGDPFVFGRGGEEALTLRAAGVSFEIVPGISSALAASAYSGAPLTHRGLSTGAIFVSGHEERDRATVDWAKIAATGLTVCIYMGMARIRLIRDGLLEGGLDPATPCAVVQWAACADQRTLRSTLGHLVEDVVAQGFGSPAIIIVGKVAALADELNWIGEQARSLPQVG